MSNEPMDPVSHAHTHGVDCGCNEPSLSPEKFAQLRSKISDLASENEWLKANTKDWKRRLAPELYQRIATLEAALKLCLESLPWDDKTDGAYYKARAALGDKEK